MKKFLGRVLATLVALTLFSFFGLVFLGLLLGGGETPRQIDAKTLLTLDLSVPIADQPPRQQFDDLVNSAVRGEVRQSHTLREVVAAIDRAASDDRISGLFIKGVVAREGYSSGWAALREVRQAVARFVNSGKPVISWQEDLDEATLYTVSPARQIVLHPLGLVEFNGLAVEALYFHDALEKYGVGVQAVRVGRYKSAVEPFLRSGMSEENRRQLDALLSDLAGEAFHGIAASRGLKPERLMALTRQKGVLTADEARETGLVTDVGYYDLVLDQLRKLTGTDEDRPIERQINVADYFQATDEKGGDGNVVVLYAEGTIVSGDELLEVGADRLARLLRKARLDKKVKAVVLRVNSPGGSAVAADVIQRELRLLKAAKPVVVSMGTVAASGGYWISADANEIWVEPNTITGSIGVFGLFFNLEQLAQEHGINRAVVRTSPLADFNSLLRPKSDAELAAVRRIVDRIYGAFIDLVARGRHLPRDKVEQLAQGRVWSGKQALALGLADHQGGLREAIAAAADRAGLKKYQVVEYQRAENWIDLLMKAMGVEPEEGDARQSELKSLMNGLRTIARYTDPRGIYARLPFDLSIH